MSENKDSANKMMMRDNLRGDEHAVSNAEATGQANVTKNHLVVIKPRQKLTDVEKAASAHVFSFLALDIPVRTVGGIFVLVLYCCIKCTKGCGRSVS